MSNETNTPLVRLFVTHVSSTRSPFSSSARSVETDQYSNERFHESVRWPRNTSARISGRKPLQPTGPLHTPPLCLSHSYPQAIVEQRWLTRLPPLLFICLNRYRFSQTTKQTSKIVAPFEFYPELYLDRYMLNNKNLVVNKRNIARTLYNQLHDLENTLNRYVRRRRQTGRCHLSL